MDNNRKHLMKHFSTVLKNLSVGKKTENLTSENLVHYYSRKELLDMVHRRFDGKIPKHINLVEAEKKDLLSFIGNELYLITYTIEKWCEEIDVREEPKEPTKKQEPAKTESKTVKPQTKANDTKTKK